MKMKVYLWIVAFSIFTSCVDSKYDLDKIDTDNVLVGDEWVLPLGTGVIKVTDVVDVNEVSDLKTDEAGNYYMRFQASASVNRNQQRGNIALPPVTIEVGNLSNLFSGDFTLGLANPHLIVGSDMSGDGNLLGSLSLTGRGGKQNIYVTEADFTLTGPGSKAWIGPVDPRDDAYHFTENAGIPELMQQLPQTIEISANVTLSGSTASLRGLNYLLDIPFIPSEQFSAISVETIENAFDDTFIDYAFSSGTATIFGTFDNELPFDVLIKMHLTNDNGVDVGIDLPSQQVVGIGPKDVSFLIKAEDMPKMKDARNIELEFTLSGRPGSDAAMVGEGKYLNKNQKMTMNLKLKKTGGIKL